MGAWDPVWDTIFSARQWGKYPKEELIRFVARHYYSVPDRSAVRFLDLGCGFGSSSWYLANEGFAVDAIDGSKVVIEQLRGRIASTALKVDLAVGDIIDLPYPSGSFDCVIDIACLQHNSPADCTKILEGVYDRMKPGGRLFSFSLKAGCWGDGSGVQVAENTYTAMTEGPCVNAGLARFSTEQQILDIYGKFELQLDVSELTVGGRAHRMSYWLIEGLKA